MKRAALVALAAAVVVAAPHAATPKPVAFQRPATAADRYTGLHRSWRVADSRLVARSVVRRPNRLSTARLYLLRRTDRLLCFVLRDVGEAASCASSLPLGTVHVTLSRVLAGVAANDVTRVVVIGTRGRRHTVKLTRDHGFIWDCRAYSGCSSVTVGIEGYNRGGRRVYSTNW
jgi:hypothetical protein